MAVVDVCIKDMHSPTRSWADLQTPSPHFYFFLVKFLIMYVFKEMGTGSTEVPAHTSPACLNKRLCEPQIRACM